MEKIVITGDLTRPNSQEPNIRFLYELLRPQLKWIDKKAEIVLHNKFDHKNQLDWIDFEYTDHQQVHPTLEAFSKFYTLFITFEASDRLKNDFRKRNVLFIDIIAHPIRFTRDITIGFQSSFCKLDSKWIITNEQIEIEASLVKAGCSYLPGIECKENSMLLLGQTPFDRSIIWKNKFLTFLDFEREIKELASKHNQILYKHHPYDIPQVSDRIFDSSYGISGKEPLIVPKEINTYRLLCEPNISTVCSISSSVLYEAPFFGKKTVQLASKNLWSNYVPIKFETLITPMFWFHVLSQITESSLPPEIQVPSEASLMRKLIRSSWSFDF